MLVLMLTDMQNYTILSNIINSDADLVKSVSCLNSYNVFHCHCKRLMSVIHERKHDVCSYVVYLPIVRGVPILCVRQLSLKMSH